MWRTDTQTKYDLFFQRGLLLDVVFDGIFFLRGWIVVASYSDFLLPFLFISSHLLCNLWG